MCRASYAHWLLFPIHIILIYPKSFAARAKNTPNCVEWLGMVCYDCQAQRRRTHMHEMAGRNIIWWSLFSGSGKLDRKLHKDWTKIQTMIHTNQTRGCRAGGVRRRNTGEGNGWKNSRSTAGLTKVMCCRCGGRAPPQNTKKTILIEFHQTIFAIIANKRTVTHSSLGHWCFAIS